MMQAWGFIAPGLYKRERRWAMPFIVSTAGLFIAGGLFCYFVAMRFALAFLMGLAFEPGVRPMISLTSYYDMFFNLHVGLGAVFQMPIVIFFLTLLRITSPGFLMRNGRYAILIIFVIAAVITPTPDVTTMLTFAAPMILLYYFGIGVSYIIVLKREGKAFPWKTFALIVLALLAVAAAILAVMHFQMGYQFTPEWPFYRAAGLTVWGLGGRSARPPWKSAADLGGFPIHSRARLRRHWRSGPLYAEVRAGARGDAVAV